MITLAVYAQYDPSHTTGLRNDAARAFRSQLRDIAASVRQVVVISDGFSQGHTFDRPNTAGQVTAFMSWLERETEATLLNTRMGWSDTFIYAAFRQGVLRGHSEMLSAGYQIPTLVAEGGLQFIMEQPTTQSLLELVNIRVYNELKGIAAAMYQNVSRNLIQGLAEGLTPIQLANSLISGIRTIYNRGNLLVRNEIIRSHHLAMVQEYRRGGVAGVTVMAEVLTAGDDKVCDSCSDLEGKVFTLDEIENMLPYHGGCRCICLPKQQLKGE